ncbi:hypothetical protein Mal52_55710 [Symmachiella dynata]|uniref:Uncharacterized protein n=1 Tax=Symmachiella dynata TaxID=2527995 RepID=A0A517ZX30_9PLAN|nr:hypothetical protein [Symmachiella dynata]QDU47043.1 hypothetical protein Mal52_55710 [Symmachiella dynata]
MNTKFDVNHALKSIRIMSYWFIALLVMCPVWGFFFGRSDDGGGMTNSMFIFFVAMTIAGPLGSVLTMVYGMFQSQQSEIEDLKSVIKQLQGTEQPVESM